MSLTTAVVLASGYGTRMLPITSAVQKEMLPILNRPVVDYVVADLVAAGITRILLMVRPGESALHDYYTGNSSLEAHLKRFGKDEALEKLKQIQSQATFEFLDGIDAEIGYGSAVPIILAAKAGRLPEDEAFLVCDGDAFSWHADGSCESSRLIETFTHSAAAGAISALTAPSDQLHQYGVLQVKTQEGREYLDRLVEKPEPGKAPSNLINISKYVLTPTLLPYIMDLKPSPKSGEFYLTSAIDTAAKDHPVAVHRAAGDFLDTGTLDSWLKANMIVSAHRQA